MNNKIIALWCVPRSISTAFERIFKRLQELGEAITVMHEPFASAYYFGTDRKSNRYVNDQKYSKIIDKTNYQKVMDEIIKESNRKDIKKVFFKDVAYVFAPVLERYSHFFFRIQNTFIIRNPRDALVSHFKLLPDFTINEAGYLSIEVLYDLTRKNLRQNPIVVDAEKFCNNPEKIIQKFCHLVEIDYNLEALHWKKGLPDEFKIWDEWHKKISKTTKIEQYQREDINDIHNPQDCKRVENLAKQYNSIYKKLLKYAI